MDHVGTTTEMTTVDAAKPAKVPQPHGGALNAGGIPGNRGGIGSPPSEVRRMARAIFAERMPVLEQIAEGRVVVPLTERCRSCGYEPTPSDEQAREQAIERAVRPSEQVRAMEVLGRIGMGPAVSIDDVKARMIAQVRVLREWAKDEGVTTAQVEALLNRFDAVWR